MDDATLLAGSQCTKTIDDLKKGPADFSSIISSGQQFTDYDFNPSGRGGVQYLRWTDV